MTKLTDQLNDPNYTPRVVQAEQGFNAIGQLGKLGANILDGLGQAQRSANSGPKNNIALDEFSAGAATILTGQPINERAAKILTNAERYDKANKDGNMSNTAYDLAMKNWMADVMNRYPDQAEEILTLGSQRGLDHYYFREAKFANDQANKQNDAKLEADNKAYQFALDNGRVGDTFEETAFMGYRLKAKQTETEMHRQLMDDLKTQAEIDKPWWDDNFRQAESAYIQGTMSQVHEAIAGGNAQLYNLYTAAEGSPERQKMLDASFDAALFDIDKLLSDVSMQLNGQGRQIVKKGENGQPDQVRFVPVPKEAYEQAKRELEAQKATITWLRNQPNEKAKRWLETQVLQNKTKAQELIPNVLAMSDTFEGMTIPAIMETLTINPGQFGLNQTEASYLLSEISKGSKKFSADSFQFIQKMTAEGRSPAFSKDPLQALKGYVQNYNVMVTFGSGLATDAYAPGDDRDKARKSFEDSAAAVVVATGRNYNMSNISKENAAGAVKNLFNPGFLQLVDGYVKAGGDTDVAQMLGAQSALAAGTFIEALMSTTNPDGTPLLIYDKVTGRAVPQPTKPQLSTGYAGLTAFGRGSVLNPTVTPDAQEKAKLVNQMLDYVDLVHIKYPVLKDEYLKGTNMSVRDVAATVGFDAYANNIQKKVQADAAIRAQEEKLFREGVTKFDYYKDGSFQIDNSPNGDGGFTSGYSGKYNLTAKAPEELQPLISKAAQDAGLDEGLFAALIKGESSFNPKARGPSIPKYKGTPDEYAIGLGQLLPSTAKEMGVTDINDPAQNLMGSAKYLKQQLDTFNGDARLALMAYNWGPQNVRRWLNNGQDVSRIPQETREYVKRILGVDLTEQQ